MTGLLAALLLISASQAQQVLEQIPDDALVVLKVRNLSATSPKIGKFMTDLAVNAFVPGIDNPLALAQQKLNMTQGVRTDGDMAIIYRDPEKTGAAKPDDAFVLLVPVSDFPAFVSNFGGAKPDGEITSIKLPISEEDGFVAQWGNFAAVCTSKEVLSKKPSTILKIPGTATNRELAGRDLVIYANMETLRPRAQQMLQMARQQGMSALEGLPQDNEQLTKFQPVIKAFATQFFNAADAFVRDSNGFTFSINFGEEGLSVASMAEFKPDSYAGTMFSSMKNTDQPLLAGLPTAKYLFYGGQLNNADINVKIISDFAAPIMKEIDAIGPETKPAHDYFDALIVYLKANKTGAFGMVAPTGALGQESLMQFVAVAEGDAKAMKDAQQKMMKSEQELMKAFDVQNPPYTVTITPNAKTVDGITFDSITTTFSADANDPKGRQQQQIMSYVYGPNGLNLMQGEVNGKFVMTMGVPDEVLSNTIATAKAGGSPMTDLATVKKVTASLPTKRIGEFYVPLDQIVGTVVSYAKAFGAPINLNMQPDLPPIGASVTTDGPSIRVEGYVPTQLVQQLVSAGMQGAAQMHGGGKQHRGGL